MGLIVGISIPSGPRMPFRLAPPIAANAAPIGISAGAIRLSESTNSATASESRPLSQSVIRLAAAVSGVMILVRLSPMATNNWLSGWPSWTAAENALTML